MVQSLCLGPGYRVFIIPFQNSEISGIFVTNSRNSEGKSGKFVIDGNKMHGLINLRTVCLPYVWHRMLLVEEYNLVSQPLYHSYSQLLAQAAGW